MKAKVKESVGLGFFRVLSATSILSKNSCVLDAKARLISAKIG